MPAETITLLFVCSGNTCRSPMAAAIARHFAQRRGDDMPALRIESAGVSASEGLPGAPEAAASLARLDIELGDHRSRSLTRQLIEDADRIYCMTPEHRQSVLAMAPDNSHKVMTLDPTGEPIPDPIGSSQTVYDQTCRTLAGLVAGRIKELDR